MQHETLCQDKLLGVAAILPYRVTTEEARDSSPQQTLGERLLRSINLKITDISICVRDFQRVCRQQGCELLISGYNGRPF
jgi:hypothetical protein